MNVDAWGPCAWEFLHALPWLRPTEILSPRDAVAALRFTVAVGDVLPCRYCRESYAVFAERLGVARSLTFEVPRPARDLTADDYRDNDRDSDSGNDSGRSGGGDVGGVGCGCVRMVTRARWARYWYAVHNLVNRKLGKREEPLWTTTVRPRPHWAECLWALLFAVAWNYPETRPPAERVRAHRTFLGELLPAVLRHTPLGRAYAAALLPGACPLGDGCGDGGGEGGGALRSRASLQRWAYAMRCRTAPVCGPPPPLADVHALMEGVRARSTACSATSTSTTPAIAGAATVAGAEPGRSTDATRSDGEHGARHGSVLGCV